MGDLKQQYTVVWLRGDASTDFQAAEQLAKDKGTALMTKAGRYALRVRAEAADQVRADLGLTPGKQFILQGFPIHVDADDVTAVLQAMGWPASVLPNRRRVFRGMSEWRVRAGHDPPRDKIALNMGDTRVNLAIKPAERNAPAPTQPSRPPPRSWAEAVALGAQRTLWADTRDSRQ